MEWTLVRFQSVTVFWIQRKCLTAVLDWESKPPDVVAAAIVLTPAS